MEIRPILSTLLRHKTAATLIVLEIALGCAIVCNALFLIGNRLAHMQRPSGVDEAHLVFIRTNGISDDAEAKAVTHADLEGLRTIPGVVSATTVNQIPFGHSAWNSSIKLKPDQDTPTLTTTNYMVAEDGLKTLGLKLLEGRDFNPAEYVDFDVNEFPAVMLTRAMAQRLFPGQSAIGKRINPNRDAGQWATVIGVVGHVHRAGPQSEGEPQIYVPHTQSAQTTMSIVARGSSAATSLVLPIRAAVRALDPDLPVSKVQPMEAAVSRALAKQRFDALLLGVFAFTALLLASIGLYGVMAYLVAQRTREIGIRMALGGQPRAIRGMVLREGLLISVLGLGVGTAISLAGSRALSGLLFGVTATDGVTYGAIAGILLVVGALASYGPARRATRVDPLIALRD